MTKDEALQLVWDMAAERFVNATRRLDMAEREEWLRFIDRMEREWKWLRKKRQNIPRLRDIEDGAEGQENGNPEIDDAP